MPKTESIVNDRPRARIVALGSYAPKKILTNADIEKIVDTTDQWIIDRTGIRERHVAADSEAASDLALKASKQALKNAGLRPRDVDVIILASVSTDSPFPSTACVLQSKLGAKNAFAFDINAACSGFVYGLQLADMYIQTGMAKTILLVGAEVLTKFVDWEDRSTCVLFGDGAGAAVITASNSGGVIDILMRSDGTVGDLIHIPGGGSAMPPSEQTILKKQHYMKMKGNELFKFAVTNLEKTANDLLKRNNLKTSDITMLVPHQANLRIIQATAKRLNLPMERVFVNLERYGNTSAASIPLALDEAVSTLRIRKDDIIMLEAIGAGVTWAAALMKW